MEEAKIFELGIKTFDTLKPALINEFVNLALNNEKGYNFVDIAIQSLRSIANQLERKQMKGD